MLNNRRGRRKRGKGEKGEERVGTRRRKKSRTIRTKTPPASRVIKIRRK